MCAPVWLAPRCRRDESTASAGLVATGMQGFWVRAVVGLVFLAAVVFHLSMDQPQRLARLKQLFRFGGARAPASAARPGLPVATAPDETESPAQRNATWCRAWWWPCTIPSDLGVG